MIIRLWWVVALVAYYAGISLGAKLRTSSLLTCMENSQFQPYMFDVSLDKKTHEVLLNVDAITTLTGSLYADVKLIAYGITVMTQKVDFCSLDKILCSPRTGRISLNTTYSVSEDIIKRIPNIAYTVPDLDAQVLVSVYTLDDVDHKNPLACVLAVLSNDKTVQTRYASWPIAVITSVGIFTSGAVSILGHSTTAAHIASNSISLFVYFQNLAITSMMGVSRVPPIAAAWVQNFQWSMGIINIKFLQNVFKWYVQSTGGTPVVVHENKHLLFISVQKRMVKRAIVDASRYIVNQVPKFGDTLSQLVRKTSVSTPEDLKFENTFKDSDLYTTDERRPEGFTNKMLVLHGIQRVAFKAGIELSNVFLTGITTFLFFTIFVIVAVTVFKAFVGVLVRNKAIGLHSKFIEYKKGWGNIIKGTLFRIAIIAFPQLTLLSIWEFTQSDSIALVVDSVFIFLIICGVLFYGAARVILRARESNRLYKTPAYLLYGDSNFLNRYGFLYVQFKANLYWWLVPVLLYSFLRSLIIAVLQNNGKAQALIIFIIELVYFISVCLVRPYLDERTNIFNIAVHLINFLNSIFFLFFSNIFKHRPIVSSIMAVVLFVLNSSFAFFLLIFTFVTCFLALVHKNPDTLYRSMKDDRDSFLPKVGYAKSEEELQNLGKTIFAANDVDSEKKIFNDSPPSGSKSGLDGDYDDSPANSSQRLDFQPSKPFSNSLGVPALFKPDPGYQKVPTALSTSQLNKSAYEKPSNNNYSGATQYNPFLAHPESVSSNKNKTYDGFIRTSTPYNNVSSHENNPQNQRVF